MNIVKRMLVLFICAMITVSSVIPVYCDDPLTEQDGGSGGLSDIGTKAEDALDEGTNLLYRIAAAAFPVGLILLLFLLFLTRNDKKASMYIGLIGSCLLAFLGIILVYNGTAFKLLEKLANLFAL